jgi:hypothetical protein
MSRLPPTRFEHSHSIAAFPGCVGKATFVEEVVMHAMVAQYVAAVELDI